MKKVNTTIWLRLFVVISLQRGFFIQASCPARCTCERSSVKCSKISSIPSNFPPYTTILDISNNNITKISKGVFNDKLTYLYSLNLARNLISEIEPGAFEMFYLLNELRLEQNKLVEINIGIFTGLSSLSWLNLQRNNITQLRKGTFNKTSKIDFMDLSRNNIYHIENEIFTNLPSLQTLNLSGNSIPLIQNVMKGLFSLRILDLSRNAIRSIKFDDIKDLSSLTHLNLSRNRIAFIHHYVFIGLSILQELNLQENNIANLSMPEAFRGPFEIKHIYLQKNRIQEIKPGVFKGARVGSLILNENEVTNVKKGTFHEAMIKKTLDLSSNKIATIQQQAFIGITGGLEELKLSNNRIKLVHERLLLGLMTLKTIKLSNNLIELVQPGAFDGLRLLEKVYLDGNNLTHLDSVEFKDSVSLETLTLHRNRLKRLPSDVVNHKFFYLTLQYNDLTDRTDLRNLTSLYNLFLSSNRMSKLSNINLKNKRFLTLLFLDKNNFTHITNHMFIGAYTVAFITLASNPIKVIEEEAFLGLPNLRYVNLFDTQIAVPLTIWPAKFQVEYLVPQTTDATIKLSDLFMPWSDFMDTAGYICEKTNYFLISCETCRRGSFKARNQNKCFVCPPGGFYQDEPGYTGEFHHGYGCKQCPPGSYVKPELAPGKSESDCQTCPQGTYSKAFAKFRACRCMDGYYRLDRFGPCTICTKGYICSNESVTLDSGFYWLWESKGNLKDYEAFSKDLIISGPAYMTRKFQHSIPRPYACPIEGSCLGGHLSKCQKGYTGPLCAVCDKRYYNMIAKCQKCPSLPWIIAQMICLVVVVVFFILFILWEKKKQADRSSRSVTDIFLARLKIIIGFYQISSSTFDSFSYIKWPGPIRNMMKYAKLLQLNLLQIAPPNCIKNTLKSDAYANFLFNIGLSVLLIVTGMMIRFFIKCYVKNKTSVIKEDKRVKEIEYKQKSYRCLFLLLFITFPSTCTHILQMLPAACHKICSLHEVNCNSYLKADYSIQCNTPKHDIYGTLSTISIIYCIGFPLTLFLILRRAKRQGKLGDAASNENGPILNGLRFLYENYSPICWFWEILELARKIFFSSLLILMNAESRTSLGLTSMVSGMYSVLFALYKPIEDTFEHWLQMASLLASSVNFTVGMLMKVPSDETSSGVGEQTDELLVTVILVLANVAVVAIIAVKYLSNIITAVVTWKNEPKCNVSCCLEILQLVSDAQGEVGSVCTEPKINENLFGDAGGDQPTLDGVTSNIQTIEEDAEENEDDKEKNM